MKKSFFLLCAGLFFPSLLFSSDNRLHIENPSKNKLSVPCNKKCPTPKLDSLLDDCPTPKLEKSLVSFVTRAASNDSLMDSPAYHLENPYRLEHQNSYGSVAEEVNQSLQYYCSTPEN